MVERATTPTGIETVETLQVAEMSSIFHLEIAGENQSMWPSKRGSWSGPGRRQDQQDETSEHETLNCENLRNPKHSKLGQIALKKDQFWRILTMEIKLIKMLCIC
jgi:hypothetical protein